MKKHIFLLYSLTVLCISTTVAQTSDKIPAVVKTEFDKRYPNQEVAWSKEKRSYIARFEEHGRRDIVRFNGRGKMTQRGWYIIFSKLPEPAMVYLNKYYKEQVLTDAFKDNILKTEYANGDIMYKVPVDSKELIFSGKGVLTKIERQRK